MLNSKPINLNAVFGHDVGVDINMSQMEPDMFGIEVELEGRKLKTTDPAIMRFWTNHVDNSLRVTQPGAESTEYVLRNPLNRMDTQTACFLLMNFLNTNPHTEVFDSYRTSIHVHVNCLHETVRTVCNFITLCIIFDELLVSQNGEHRIGNNFCLRTKDAEGQVEELCSTVRNYGSLYNMSGNHRYSSINFVSLMKFGTVEFRSLECTTDLERLATWIDICQGLKVAARQYSDPKEIISKFSRRGPIGFMISHLGDHYAKYAAVPDAHHILQNGMRLAQDFAYCSDWVQKDEKEIKKTKKPSKYGALVQHQWAPPPPANPAAFQDILNHVNMQQFQPAQGAPIFVHHAPAVAIEDEFLEEITYEDTLDEED